MGASKLLDQWTTVNFHDFPSYSPSRSPHFSLKQGGAVQSAVHLLWVVRLLLMMDGSLQRSRSRDPGFSRPRHVKPVENEQKGKHMSWAA